MNEKHNFINIHNNSTNNNGSVMNKNSNNNKHIMGPEAILSDNKVIDSQNSTAITTMTTTSATMMPPHCLSLLSEASNYWNGRNTFNRLKHHRYMDNISPHRGRDDRNNYNGDASGGDDDYDDVQEEEEEEADNEVDRDVSNRSVSPEDNTNKMSNIGHSSHTASSPSPPKLVAQIPRNTNRRKSSRLDIDGQHFQGKSGQNSPNHHEIKRITPYPSSSKFEHMLFIVTRF
ncbi:unnamed protein product [Heterobilharzia americana]|nr:unnamed protein product [Heterobilharzia americana]